MAHKRALLVLCVLHLASTAFAAPWPVNVLKRIVAPFRSNPFLQSRASPCPFGASCFLPTSVAKPASVIPEVESSEEDASRVVSLELRAEHRGPFSHHWLEVESSAGKVTIGYGPATLPFIDAQISLHDSFGNIERISGMSPVPVLGLPPLSYLDARAPGEGHQIGKAIPMTISQADTLVRKVRRSKFIGPYIPIFHDCRTYACTVQATAQGRSSLPCYLLFKGYW